MLNSAALRKWLSFFKSDEFFCDCFDLSDLACTAAFQGVDAARQGGDAVVGFIESLAHLLVVSEQGLPEFGCDRVLGGCFS